MMRFKTGGDRPVIRDDALHQPFSQRAHLRAVRHVGPLHDVPSCHLGRGIFGTESDSLNPDRSDGSNTANSQ